MPRTRDAALRKVYPEAAAGGFSRVDGGIEMYSRINALLNPDSVLVNLGAGRGEWVLEDPVPYRRGLQTFRGRVGRVIGLDVDPVVQTNPDLDEAHIIRPDGPFPLADESADLLIADNLFEHLEYPAATAAQIGRVLRPGGWVCARTPNLYGYIATGARLIPKRLHHAVLSKVQAERKEEDVFPAFYRLNTRAALRRHFPPEIWDHHVYAWSAEPAYVGYHPLAWQMARGVMALVPPPLRETWLIFLRKR